MPKIFRQDCAHCGNYYEGYGEKYCSHDCSVRASREKHGHDEALPDPGEFGIDIEEDGDEITATATGSQITTLEELLEAADVDREVWEVERHVINKWDVGMKGPEGEVRVQPLWQVKAWLQKKWEHSSMPSPVMLEVTRPNTPASRDGPYTSLHYSDLHLPHHDPRALNLLYQILDYVGPDFVADHGDTLDCEQISDYPKDPMHRVGLKEEIQMGARHLGRVHALTPDADHWWTEGNHEERMRRLVWKMCEKRHAGEILTLPAVQEALEWPSLLGIGELGWEATAYPEHKLFHDRLILTHGEKVRQDSGKSEKAEYDHYGKSGISGHTHRVGYYGRRDYNGQHGWWGLGCLCSIRNDYVSFPNWQQGFAVLTWSEDRTDFALERVRIFEGVAYFRGRRFEGDSTLFGDIAEEAA